eukprot:TRINITY_DN8709_c0_g1_i9.p1 TRINITY_DN8709_c0_g1~~TRINITY_DN8709_c0_g1_i9.p1  ORF type:complete len:520 (+),score=170.12 TRINITY_DN8709_c0_g1_i9:1-1560(+)
MLGGIPSLTAKTSPNFVFGCQFISPQIDYPIEHLKVNNPINDSDLPYVTLKRMRAKSHERDKRQAQDESSEPFDLDSIKKKLNEKAEEQKLTLSSKTTEETDKPSILVSKQRNTQETNTTASKDCDEYRVNEQKVMKLLSKELVEMSRKHNAELVEIKSELEDAKQHLRDNEAFALQLKNLSIWVSKQLSECILDIGSLLNKVKEIRDASENFELTDQEKLFHVVSSVAQISSANTGKLMNLLKSLRSFAQATERGCYDCKESIDSASQTEEMDVAESKKKLAKILSLVVLRMKGKEVNVNLSKTKDSLLAELKTAISAKEYHQKEEEKLKREVEELTAKLNEECNQSVVLTKQIKEQEEYYRSKLVEEMHNKDVEFLSKMKEMKVIFTEMVREKEEKQAEIEGLLKRNSMLEGSLAEFKEIELTKNRLNESAALIASMVLAQSSDTPKVVPKDMQSMKNTFEDQAKELLNEIAIFKQYEEILREEVEKGIVARKILRSMTTVSEGMINRRAVQSLRKN